jgi:hypothetical protein
MWFATTIILDENEIYIYNNIIQHKWHPMIDENLIVFVVGYVIHKWLHNMWHFKFQLLL